MDFGRTKIISIVLILILVLATFTRFYGLKDRGIFIGDEGYHINGAKTYLAVTSYVYKKVTHQPIELSFSDYMFQHGGGYPYAGKPGIYPMILLFLLLFGVHDYSHLFLSATLGVGSILLVYLIGREVYNKRVGVIAALLLALSPYHIHYSRSGLSTAPSAFFTLFALYFYIKSIKGHGIDTLHKKSTVYIMFTGMFAASAFACHYNLFWFFPFLFFIDILHYLVARKTKLIRQVMRLLFFNASFIVTFGMYMLPYQIAKYITKGLATKGFGKPYHIQSYVEQLEISTLLPGSIPLSLNNSAYYVRLLKIIENPLMLILAIIGIFLIMYKLKKKFNTPDVMILSLCIFPIAVWSFYIWKGGRTIGVLIPFFIISASYSIDYFSRLLIQSKKFKQIALPLLFTVLVVFGIYKSAPVILAKSHYKAAIDFMREQGNIKHISDRAIAVSVFYAGNENTNKVSFSYLTPSKVISLYKNEDYRFFLNVAGRSEDHIYGKFLYERIRERNVKPVFVVESSPYFELFEFREIKLGTQLRKDTTIEVYELKDILG